MIKRNYASITDINDYRWASLTTKGKMEALKKKYGKEKVKKAAEKLIGESL